MDRRALLMLAASGVVAANGTAQAAKAPDTWDGLYRVKSKKMDGVYLLPGADFKPYDKVQLPTPEVAFHKHWRQDYNASGLGLSGQVSDKDAQDIAERVRKGFAEIFAKAYQDAGYAVVDEAAPDVLRVRTAVADLSISAPDRDYPGIVRTYAVDAGSATLVVEARDSLTHALMGRAVDARTAGDMSVGWRTRASNEGDFQELFQTWAKLAAKGLTELKALSPIQRS